MSYDEVAEKFAGCAAFANWDADRARQVVETVRDLESLESVRNLTALLAD